MMIYLAFAVMAIAACAIAYIFLRDLVRDDSPQTITTQSHNMYDLNRLKKELIYTDAYEGSPLIFYGGHSKSKIAKSYYQVDLPSYRVSNEERGLIVGVTGTGKTNFILAQIFDWMQSGKSLVVIDVKPEIWAILETNDIFNMFDYEPIIVNPTDLYSHKYNFLDDIDFNDLDEMLAVVIVDDNDNATAFKEFARRMLKAIILYLKDKNGTVSLTECYELINSYARSKSLFDDLKAYDNKEVQAMANLALQSSENERFISSGMTALTTALSMFGDKTIAEMTRTSDFSLNEVLKERQKIIFLQFEQLSQEKTAALFATTVQHLIRLMIQNNHERDDVFIILDELTNSSTIPQLPTQFNLMRAYKMPAFMYVQTISSLYTMFGKEKATHLINSCSLKICYRTNDYETAKLFSDLAGTVEIQKFYKANEVKTRKDGSTYTDRSSKPAGSDIVPLIPPDAILQFDSEVVCIYKGKAGVIDIPQMWEHTPITERATFNAPRDLIDELDRV